MDDILLLVNRWLHLIAAIVAVGGMLFMRMVLVPAVREALTDEQRAALHANIMRSWKRISMVAIVVLVVTGIGNFVWVSMPQMSESEWKGLYHMLFGVKFLAAFGVFFIASALTGSSKALEGIRANGPRWLAIAASLGIAVVVLAGVLGHLRQMS